LSYFSSRIELRAADLVLFDDCRGEELDSLEISGVPPHAALPASDEGLLAFARDPLVQHLEAQEVVGECDEV